MGTRWASSSVAKRSLYPMPTARPQHLYCNELPCLKWNGLSILGRL